MHNLDLIFSDVLREELYRSYQRHNGFAILELLAFLALLVIALNFFQPSCGMSYAVHNKGHSGPAILVFLTFLALLVVVFDFFSFLVF